MSAADHDRVAVLRARTDDAISDLASLRSTDPAATGALQAVRLTAHTLRSFWVPALDELLARYEPGR